jgi:hypothetical protein
MTDLDKLREKAQAATPGPLDNLTSAFREELLQLTEATIEADRVYMAEMPKPGAHAHLVALADRARVAWSNAAKPQAIRALILERNAYADRLQRVETALPILRELALPSSMATDPDGECFFCGGDANEPEDHAGDCLVTLARAALEGGSE